MDSFAREVQARIDSNATDERLRSDSRAFLLSSIAAKYSYNFSWLSRPIIQYPQDVVAMQELIWRVKPDLVIETGIAHGGSLVMSASILALLDYCDALEQGRTLDPRAPRRRVVGVDIDIRPHNRSAIASHAMSHRIEMIQGSSVAAAVIAQVREIAARYERILVCLDSNHTHEHVLAELEAYAPLTSVGSYCCVFDTVIEDLPEDAYPDRPWGRGDNPKTAVHEYLRRLQDAARANPVAGSPRFEIDHTVENKLLVTVAPDGYLRRVA